MIPKFPIKHLANIPLAKFFLALSLSLLPVSGWAEILPPSEEQPWYQVNIAIFKRPQHLLQSEQWKTGEQVKASFPRTTIALENDDALPDGEDGFPDTLEAPTHSAALSAPDITADNTSTPTLPPAFRALVATDEEFNKVVSRLNRSPNYEILYQTTWLQPPLSQDEALAVLIQAGENYDGLYELEGTTSLHVARYLHLDTKIRLAKYVQQIEVIKPWWQGSEANSAFDNSQADGFNEGFTIELGQETMQLQDGVEQPLEPSFEPQSVDSSEAGFTGVGNFTQLDLEETVTRYQSIRTGVMDESRRMRSGELHYIDHPLFGMVVKVMPYFPEVDDANDTSLAEGIVNP